MFGSKDRAAPTPVKETRITPHSHIAQGMIFKGDVDGDIDILIDGKLEGNLRCRSVTIGETGELRGRIIAQEAVVNGRIEGTVDSKIVRLNRTATIIGDVRHEVIEVAAGARIEGNYSHIVDKAQARPKIKSSQKVDSDDLSPVVPSGGIPSGISLPDGSSSGSSAIVTEMKPH